MNKKRETVSKSKKTNKKSKNVHLSAEPFVPDLSFNSIIVGSYVDKMIRMSPTPEKTLLFLWMINNINNNRNQMRKLPPVMHEWNEINFKESEFKGYKMQDFVNMCYDTYDLITNIRSFYSIFPSSVAYSFLLKPYFPDSPNYFSTIEINLEENNYFISLFILATFLKQSYLKKLKHETTHIDNEFLNAIEQSIFDDMDYENEEDVTIVLEKQVERKEAIASDNFNPLSLLSAEEDSELEIMSSVYYDKIKSCKSDKEMKNVQKECMIHYVNSQNMYTYPNDTYEKVYIFYEIIDTDYTCTMNKVLESFKEICLINNSILYRKYFNTFKENVEKTFILSGCKQLLNELYIHSHSQTKDQRIKRERLGRYMELGRREKEDEVLQMKSYTCTLSHLMNPETIAFLILRCKHLEEFTMVIDLQPSMETMRWFTSIYPKFLGPLMINVLKECKSIKIILSDTLHSRNVDLLSENTNMIGTNANFVKNISLFEGITGWMRMNDDFIPIFKAEYLEVPFYDYLNRWDARMWPFLKHLNFSYKQSEVTNNIDSMTLYYPLNNSFETVQFHISSHIQLDRTFVISLNESANVHLTFNTPSVFNVNHLEIYISQYSIESLNSISALLNIDNDSIGNLKQFYSDHPIFSNRFNSFGVVDLWKQSSMSKFTLSSSLISIFCNINRWTFESLNNMACISMETILKLCKNRFKPIHITLKNMKWQYQKQLIDTFQRALECQPLNCRAIYYQLDEAYRVSLYTAATNQSPIIQLNIIENNNTLHHGKLCKICPWFCDLSCNTLF
jgi:hypothetical protein